MTLNFDTSPRPRFRFSLPTHLKAPFLISFLVSAVLGLLALIFAFQAQPVVPIFYSLALTTQQLAPRQWLFLFPIISFSISIVHLLLVNVYREYDQLLLQLFTWTTVGIQVLLALSLLRILIIIS